MLPFQIGPTPHCWPLVNQDGRRDSDHLAVSTADMQCHWLKVDSLPDKTAGDHHGRHPFACVITQAHE